MYSYYGPPSTAVQQTAGLTYNAQSSQWVPTASVNRNNNNYNSPVMQYSQQHSFPVNNNNNNSKRVPPPNPVVTFTNYYHGWKAVADGKRPLPPNLTKEWASYYADLSSRAAHFFHSQPQATMAEFDLPPAPPPENNNALPSSSLSSSSPVYSTPVANAAGNYPGSASYSQQQQQQSHGAYAHNYAAVNTSSSAQPLTYQQYMEKCLEQCRTEAEKKAMHQKLQEVIQQAVVDGSMSRDWSQVALIPVERQQVAPATANRAWNASTIHPQSQGNVSYYGPSSTSGATAIAPSDPRAHNFAPTEEQHDTKKRRRWDASPSNKNNSLSSDLSNSYYGPSDNSVGSKSSQKRGKNKANTVSSSNYYGPPSVLVPTSTNPTTTSKNKKWKRNDSGFDKSNSTLNERARRFASSISTSASFDEDSYEMTSQGPIVKGTSKILEKDYLRLTSAPRPELVRPKPILEKHVKNLLTERQDEVHRRDYLWFCSQLKAVRQDLTVQHIQDAFTVHVYETHARIALEEGDVNEYNQCQTQLKYLYEQLESEGSEEGKKALVNRDEFVAYRLLYSVLLTQNEKYQGGSSDLMKLLQSLTSMQRKEPTIQFANRVRTAVADGNYHRFFASLKSTDGGAHAVYLLERLVPAMRKVALRRIIKAYRPMTVPVDFVLQELAFTEDKEYGKQWLQSCGCVLSEDGESVMCKESEYHESDLEEKKSLI